MTGDPPSTGTARWLCLLAVSVSCVRPRPIARALLVVAPPPVDTPVVAVAPEAPPTSRVVPAEGVRDFLRGARAAARVCFRTARMGVVCLRGRYAERSPDPMPEGDQPKMTEHGCDPVEERFFARSPDGALLDGRGRLAEIPGARSYAVVEDIWAIDARGRVLQLGERGSADGPEVAELTGAAFPRSVELQAFGHTHEGDEFRGFSAWLAPLCARSERGAVWCRAVRTGPGAVPTAADEVPRPVASLPAVAGFALSISNGCAWTPAGALWCWSLSPPGSTRTISERTIPGHPLQYVARPERWPADVVDVAMANEALCTRHRDGRVFCGRMERSGGWTAALRDPREVPEVRGALELAVDHRARCARMADATVRCWGPSREELSTGVESSRGSFARVDGLHGVEHLAAGRAHVCALDRRGVLRCWGSNSHGQIDPAANVSVTSPRVVGDGLAGVVTGEDFTCTLTGDRAVRCWGDNGAGQLGTANPEEHGPFAVEGLGRVRGLAAGGASVCAWSEDGRVRCWGRFFGGGGRRREVAGLGAVQEMAEAGDRWCARDDRGRAACWIPWERGARGRPSWQTVTPVARLVPGVDPSHRDHSGIGASLCVITTDGVMRCRASAGDEPERWSEESPGEIVGAWVDGEWEHTARSDGSFSDEREPSGLTDVAAVAWCRAYRGCVCARLRDGDVACRGDNSAGQLADGGPPPEVPALVQVELSQE